MSHHVGFSRLRTGSLKRAPRWPTRARSAESCRARNPGVPACFVRRRNGGRQRNQPILPPARAQTSLTRVPSDSGHFPRTWKPVSLHNQHHTSPKTGFAHLQAPCVPALLTQVALGTIINPLITVNNDKGFVRNVT